MYKNIYGIRILTYCCKVTCPISQAYSDDLFCKYRLTNVWNLQNNMFGPNRSNIPLEFKVANLRWDWVWTEAWENDKKIKRNRLKLEKIMKEMMTNEVTITLKFQYDFFVHWRHHFELHNNSKWQLKKETPMSSRRERNQTSSVVVLAKARI